MYWQCRDKKVEYGDKTLIMGIVNITPDSFSDGGRWLEEGAAVTHALSLIEDGADIIDLGAQSTRPGYEEISPKEERERLVPVLKGLREKSNVLISVDTYFPEVARAALENGADIINDVSGKITPEKAELICSSGAGWIITFNGAGGVKEAAEFFNSALKKCYTYGIKKEQLCFDMGIGFKKCYEQDMELISNIKEYKVNEIPLLIGLSRKRVIGRASGEEIPEKRLAGNIAAHTAAILGGADIIRLHDVNGEIKGIRTAEEIRKWTK